ncbi:hypothetical protein [Niabella drilacis]|uniref:Uncharacterized protein n=1 Tax=Niabella drilacis (strain DSM 25811 / CCM 8410 / CCUG 62505 / LMG 26954 / E90) TaxID=1285928 RepID=A0A1G6QCH9_NIADE|nr:hypothetical protein [Niabella drilacis]SDC90079.1 hypothetical protein SAMN04487894_104361 [Niabella drilacis]
MEETKLSLSSEEWSIVADPEIILTKNAVLRKIKAALESLSHWQLGFVRENAGRLPEAVFEYNGKISKGENYKGLPYLILDYPRHFRPGHIFAVRSMFWWGKQVSVTLHLSGEWKERFADQLTSRLEGLKNEALYLSCHGDEWEHDVRGGSHILLSGPEHREGPDLLRNSSFIKLTYAAPVDQLERAPEFWREKFRNLTELLR